MIATMVVALVFSVGMVSCDKGGSGGGSVIGSIIGSLVGLAILIGCNWQLKVRRPTTNNPGICSLNHLKWAIDHCHTSSSQSIKVRQMRHRHITKQILSILNAQESNLTLTVLKRSHIHLLNVKQWLGPVELVRCYSIAAQNLQGICCRCARCYWKIMIIATGG